ncbi:acyl-CoA dehydrogenase family protein [Angustibacter sp. McL0619]|uniref:acyl-CoA dehydrogenase family protein n=1 Tax=Angustibacter sp. McL0619 TaxID=3415676 RepID=UPI003CE7E03D
MVAWDLEPDQRALAEWARERAAQDLLPLVEAGEPGVVNRPLLRAMGDLGLLARLFPGFGPAAPKSSDDGVLSREAAAFDLCLLREALARESTEAETALALQGLGAYPVLQSGTETQVRTWLPRVASGEAVAAFALTEPEAGSDAAALSLRAERDGDGWRLTGTKMWISNAPQADVYTVFARTTPGAGARGVSGFVVPGDRAGVSGQSLDLLSPHPIGRLELDGVRVSADELLGEPDRGFAVAMRTLDLFRPSVGAFAVGMAQAALDASVRHARGRVAFGLPLAQQQSVAHRLAEMATRTQSARLLVYQAAAAYDAGRIGVSTRAAMAKLAATETAQWVVDSAVQIHGARALERGHLLEHLYREVRAPRIYEGASEVQLGIIARELLREGD